MSKNIWKYILTAAFSLAMSATVLADRAVNGTVSGLPQNLIVTDSEGNSVSASGDYYVHIEDMQPNVLYTRDISVMNLRQDAVYSVYMLAAPDHTEGTIDLLGEVDCKLYLDGKLFYEGPVDGSGTPNIQTEGVDLGGIYNSGEIRTLHAEFIWNITDETESYMQNAGKDEAFGAVDFKWIFSASIQRGSDGSSTDGSDSKTDGSSTSSENSKSHAGGSEETEGREGHGKSTPLNRNEDSSSTSGGGRSRDGSSTGRDDGLDRDGGGPSTGEDRDGSSDNGGNGDDSGSSDGRTDSGHGTGSDNDSDGRVPGDNGEVPGGNTPDESGSNGSFIDTIVDNIPFIPADVKTGYHSSLVKYTIILLISLLSAACILAGIALKQYRLNKLRSKKDLDL